MNIGPSMRAAVLLLGTFSGVAAADEVLRSLPMVTAQSWAISDGATGAVLYEQGIDVPRQIASLTKVMTALLVLDQVASNPSYLEEIATVSRRADQQFGTTARLIQGDRLSIGQLLYALLLPSGNDAAMVLAEQVGRRLNLPTGVDVLSGFVNRMNDKAIALGMTRTTFVDVHGMGENESTARDMLYLGRFAMNNPHFREVVGTVEVNVQVRSRRSELRSIEWRNTNELLAHSAIDGIKTGQTNEAGGCLLISGGDGGQHLFVVVLGSSTQETRFLDAYNLFQWALWTSRRLD
ncbi:MAG: serine hydrolase [Proteobacteria bacterium]|jgi:serine-type D-Ala-D-Ala carboxypeptidase (penicillin-binding protein 5/6)|nr:serine hydrolase [Pseudomonadota bacterium]MDA1298902.1 serine hydrolase [Pseudomonadota bacterium]